MKPPSAESRIGKLYNYLLRGGIFTCDMYTQFGYESSSVARADVFRIDNKYLLKIKRNKINSDPHKGYYYEYSIASRVTGTRATLYKTPEKKAA